jgi:hypothetical protein
LTSAAESLESHILAFAAERARLTGEVLAMEPFRAEALGRSRPAGRGPV